MIDHDVKAALQRHWAASDANDFAAEHEIYAAHAVLEYPQSGERIRGRHNIQESRTAQPDDKRFDVRRILGGDGLWITECVIHYGDRPVYVVSIMEFEGMEVVRETQYFSEAFEPGASRSQWVERMDVSRMAGLVKAHSPGEARRLEDFEPASLLKRSQ